MTQCLQRSSVMVLMFAFLLSGTSRAHAQWIEARSAHYSIFYAAGFENDAMFTRTWLERAEQLMKDKYGITPEHYQMSVYLHPAPTATIDIDRAQNRCCTRGDAGISTGTIEMLAPSATSWKASESKSSLGMPKNDDSYHAKVLMSEYIPIGHYAVQDARPSGGWGYYSAPEWFVQGLQEYDAIFHTTDTNRNVTAARLRAWTRDNAATFTCCSPTLGMADVYNGGAVFMEFLAETFGEGVHARILRDSAATFDAALANQTKPYSLTELFGRFQAWLGRSGSVVERQTGAPRRAD